MAAASVKCPCVWLLLWLCVRLSETENTRVSKGPMTSCCHPLTHGPSTLLSETVSPSSLTTPSWAAQQPQPRLPLASHMAVVHDHEGAVSVLGRRAGQRGMNQRARGGGPAKAAGCLCAQSRLRPDAVGERYLSQEDVLNQSNPFVQLVSGVVWLLRNGEVYINQSLKAGCDKTQETGQFRTFVDVVSARRAVGHDTQGRLILFQIDGKTGQRGRVPSTYVVVSSLSSYPSLMNVYQTTEWRWQQVSTICAFTWRSRASDFWPDTSACVGGDAANVRRAGRGAHFSADALVCQPRPHGSHGVCTAVSASRVSTATAATRPAPALTAAPATPSTDAAAARHGFRGNTCEQVPYVTRRRKAVAYNAARDPTTHPSHRRSWLIVTLTLAFLLSASLLVHLVRACRGSVAAGFPEHRDYSLVPLTDINGAASRAEGDAGKSGKVGFELDDSD
ncbi:N-acetylglucosamine-1-phosphodiester alpha-N-acetylglucosaminidase-like protein [Lates japonicus]|uniref:N-acetylglucosamine-1-phosphodiester alpha-N-acetylglucosaminidase-like protein n=1 Tax=Lates japonicus TaxID=270547 RepID=A0AAD3MGC0_LATJO|nr:N-acetylglucosamine-1-phosphodiester alpha-N-acetylglucosaminidase-like protein [Lates japonicus]